jgi:hypothetical protein
MPVVLATKNHQLHATTCQGTSTERVECTWCTLLPQIRGMFLQHTLGTGTTWTPYIVLPCHGTPLCLSLSRTALRNVIWQLKWSRCWRKWEDGISMSQHPSNLSFSMSKNRPQLPTIRWQVWTALAASIWHMWQLRKRRRCRKNICFWCIQVTNTF